MTDAIGRDGYQATRVADVISLAGVSRKTFYEHFEDKEQCFIATYQQALERLLTTTSEAFESQDEWMDSLRAGLTALLDALASDPAEARIIFGEALTAGPKAVRYRNEAMGRFVHFFEAGQAQAVRELPSFAILGILGGIREIIYREVLTGRTEKLPEMVPELMYMIALPFVDSETAALELERKRS